MTSAESRNLLLTLVEFRMRRKGTHETPMDRGLQGDLGWQPRLQFAALRAMKECVIAVPALEMARKVLGIGNCSGRDVDKFKRFGLAPVPAQCVAPPLVAECFANLECKVVDTRLVNTFNIFILEVVKAWTDPAQKHPKTIHHHGYGRFCVDGEMIKLKSRMP